MYHGLEMGAERPDTELVFSIAGLFAARVLSDHFESVAIIEPDTELDYKRSRVGQWNQGHGKLTA